MRFWEKITLCVVAIVISAFIAFGIWQKDNIRSAVMVFTKSTEQIASEMNHNKKKLEQELKKKYPTIISDFTAEEERQIIDGKISVDEAVEIIKKRYEEKKMALNIGQGGTNNSQSGVENLTESGAGLHTHGSGVTSGANASNGKNSTVPDIGINNTTSGENSGTDKIENSDNASPKKPNSSTERNNKGESSGNNASVDNGSNQTAISGSADSETTNKGNSSSNGTPAANSKDVDLIVGDRIVQLYSLKAVYLGQLGQLEAQAKSAYKNLPKEQRNLVGKQSIANRYMGQALGYMESCDAEVAAILSGLESELNAVNADTSVIQTIQAAYENEKAMKKAYYVKLLD